MERKTRLALAWWAGTLLKRPDATFTTQPAFPFLPRQSEWLQNRKSTFIDYRRKPAIPFGEGVKRADWDDLGTLLNVLEALGHPGNLTVVELYRRIDEYLNTTDMDAHERTYRSYLAKVGGNSRRRAEAIARAKAAKIAQWKGA